MSTTLTSTPIIFPQHVYTVSATFVLLGTMANLILFGTLLVQVYLYYVAFPKDTRILKCSVFALLLLETAQTASLIHDQFYAFSVVFVDPNVFSVSRAGWFYAPLVTGLTASITQGIYCYRIGVLTKSKYAVALISTLSLSQLVAAIFLTIQVKSAVLFTKFLSHNINVDSVGVSKVPPCRISSKMNCMGLILDMGWM
ncbi:hypothetical protein HYPSUDRAFT_866681 [Hypholoma sublateritium FD-334 SS-4]|uniref:G-protein coupled receptors family 1 profile domain-containing protein n=1 Tax=Hypholoma sublateritium (strain FD-334 SS-4) TaxID=945553 RepID=A0A0D2Q7B0_HYPSF|nr:hypothetical protein HYPSUDRAFT_866681 [Hypholoma sublateritium FD-334 SS-4]